MYSTETTTSKIGPPWKQVNWKELTFDEASDLLAEYEAAICRIEREGDLSVVDRLSDGRREMHSMVTGMRERLDAIGESAPDAWGETKDAFVAAMTELSENYHRTIRQLRRGF